MQCTALVIDDEPLARKRMMQLLEPFSSEIEILGEAGSGAQAVKMIHEMLPDVVFLDIQMPDMDAFEVLHSLQGEDMPLVIFTTAYDNFALKAFEENTVDYLLKPVDPERLATAIEKLRRMIPQVDDTTVPPGFSWEKLCNLVDMSALYLQRLQVKVGDRIVFVNIDEVIRFHSEEKYTTVYTVNGQYVIDTPLVELEKKLDPRHFTRVHRSHIVAIDYIAECRKGDAGRMVMVLRDKAATQLVVSRSLVKKIRNL
ncbi:MAG: LytTR family DNA-binding domain-containing protein [Fibrobacter sp.]|uniref:LytR/AlgR family response regulator transcription factor n=1 Tax=unclassified Fibrobacter TaxID=2634177 RepID=UPI000922A6DE|nr:MULTISPECIES: LytTR family DNA-binding domain-containing protein [unclassified Fibrobacter]MDD5942298.1 LytTR family DNA-binding domain-containing protein [Fibrobacter sp.]MDY6387417.1 LytTR family DNA-binding domain-containing protein [Fibrobacter sp.]SHL45124.1 two component transcriptional regulator, LytTR family [Fibrobacter sp. UWH4]